MRENKRLILFVYYSKATKQMGCKTFVGTYDLGPVVLNTLRACDPWAVPHLINPFMVGVFTRTWWFAFFVAGLGELVEYTSLWAFKSFVIFLGTHEGTDFNHDVENLAGSYLEDWLFQGGLGTLMAWVFYQTFVFPAMLRGRDFWNGRILRALFYSTALFGFLIVLPSALFGIEINGHPFGRHLYYIIHLGVFVLIVIFQPKDVWKDYSRRDVWIFWTVLWLVSFIYNFQNAFDWFFSSYAQAWLISGIILVVFAVVSQVRWRWIQRIRTTFKFVY